MNRTVLMIVFVILASLSLQAQAYVFTHYSASTYSEAEKVFVEQTYKGPVKVEFHLNHVVVSSADHYWMDRIEDRQWINVSDYCKVELIVTDAAHYKLWYCIEEDSVDVVEHIPYLGQKCSFHF